MYSFVVMVTRIHSVYSLGGSDRPLFVTVDEIDEYVE